MKTVQSCRHIWVLGTLESVTQLESRLEPLAQLESVRKLTRLDSSQWCKLTWLKSLHEKTWTRLGTRHRWLEIRLGLDFQRFVSNTACRRSNFLNTTYSSTRHNAASHIHQPVTMQRCLKFNVISLFYRYLLVLLAHVWTQIAESLPLICLLSTSFGPIISYYQRWPWQTFRYHSDNDN